MDKKLSGLLIFLAGAALGSLCTWKITKDKYEIKLQNDIESVKAVYRREQNNKVSDISKQQIQFEEIEITNTAANKEPAVANIIAQYGSNDISEDAPYVITPDEFGEIEEYEAISLIYYNDLILTDDDDEPIIDADSIVGTESLSHFGEYEEDSVFVRNDRMKCDFEILRDQRNYSELNSIRMGKPNEVDD